MLKGLGLSLPVFTIVIFEIFAGKYTADLEALFFGEDLFDFH
jgi:hypothetical protein